jgi:small subunit ribosomal protein S17
MTETTNKIFRRFTGTVISTKMAKTAVVLVERTVKHKKYLKQYTVSKKYKVHDEIGEYKVGNVVMIEECRPLSKDKRWRIIKKVK